MTSLSTICGVHYKRTTWMPHLRKLAQASISNICPLPVSELKYLSVKQNAFEKAPLISGELCSSIIWICQKRNPKVGKDCNREGHWLQEGE